MPYRGAAQLLRTVLEALRSSRQRTASCTVPTSLRSVNERVEHLWNTKNPCVLSCTQPLHVSALFSAHLQPSDSKISSKRTETKYVTTSVHAECCDISSAELYSCHLPVDGQIIAPKHITGVQKDSMHCALPVQKYANCDPLCCCMLKNNCCQQPEDGQIIAPKHVVVMYKTVRENSITVDMSLHFIIMHGIRKAKVTDCEC